MKYLLFWDAELCRLVVS